MLTRLQLVSGSMLFFNYIFARLSSFAKKIHKCTFQIISFLPVSWRLTDCKKLVFPFKLNGICNLLFLLLCIDGLKRMQFYLDSCLIAFLGEKPHKYAPKKKWYLHTDRYKSVVTKPRSIMAQWHLKNAASNYICLLYTSPSPRD